MLTYIVFSLDFVVHLTDASPAIKHVFILCAFVVLITPRDSLVLVFGDHFVFGNLRGNDMPWQLLLLFSPRFFNLAHWPIYFIMSKSAMDSSYFTCPSGSDRLSKLLIS